MQDLAKEAVCLTRHSSRPDHVFTTFIGAEGLGSLRCFGDIAISGLERNN